MKVSVILSIFCATKILFRCYIFLFLFSNFRGERLVLYSSSQQLLVTWV